MLQVYFGDKWKTSELLFPTKGRANSISFNSGIRVFAFGVVVPIGFIIIICSAGDFASLSNRVIVA